MRAPRPKPSNRFAFRSAIFFSNPPRSFEVSSRVLAMYRAPDPASCTWGSQRSISQREASFGA